MGGVYKDGFVLQGMNARSRKEGRGKKKEETVKGTGLGRIWTRQKKGKFSAKKKKKLFKGPGPGGKEGLEKKKKRDKECWNEVDE